MSASLQQVTDLDFETIVLQSDVPVIVDFWAPWCTACRPLVAILESLAEELGATARIVKVNTEVAVKTTQTFGVRGLPTCIIFVGGIERTRISGARGKDRYRTLLNECILVAGSTQSSEVLARVALDQAVMFRSVEQVAEIAQANPGLLSARNEDELGSVGRAIQWQAKEIKEQLLKYSPELNHRELAGLGRTESLRDRLATLPKGSRDSAGQGATALQLAAMGGHAECCRLLLGAGFPVDATTADSVLPPLAYGVMNGHLNVVTLLLSHGASVTGSLGNVGGYLHVAAGSKSIEMVRLLQETGKIDANLLNVTGMTARDLAVAQESPDIAALLSGEA